MAEIYEGCGFSKHPDAPQRMKEKPQTDVYTAFTLSEVHLVSSDRTKSAFQRLNESREERE